MSTKDRASKINSKIPPTDRTSDEITRMLIKARVKMLLHQPFFGNLAMRLVFVDASKWCPTAATDGKFFYYNKDFIAALSPNEIIFLIGHEVLHCVYDHFDEKRRNNRHPMLWNIANDYVINDDLVLADVGEKIKLVEICHDPKYRAWGSEEIYDDLFKQMQKQGKMKGQTPQSASGRGGTAGESGGEAGPNGEMTFDHHIERDGNKGSDKDEAGKGNNDGTQGPVEFNDDEHETNKQDFEEAVIQAAKAGNGTGNLPGGVQRLIDDLQAPKIGWRELLAQQIQSTIRANYSYKTPSRKGMSAGFYMPGMDREQMIEVAIAIDTSGSIGQDMLRDFLSEVQGIMEQYNDFKINLWCFDTSVHNPIEITPDSLTSMTEYELAGFGGTSFGCNWTFMKENQIEPKKFIMFTDMYPCDGWGDPDYVDTLFIAHNGGYGSNEIVAPHGQTVQYNDK